jgi:hypothetical protein
MSDVTQILSAIEQGDARAADQLFPLTHDALRELAASKLAHEATGQTLQPTALVHEAYLKLAETKAQQWNSRGHFFAAAAEAMRRILVDVRHWTRPTSWPPKWAKTSWLWTRRSTAPGLMPASSFSPSCKRAGIEEPLAK